MHLDSRLPAYAEFFSLPEDPFSLAPNPRFLYESAAFKAAFGQLSESLRRREPLVLITGEAGTGKTTLCRCLLERLEPRTFVSVIFNPFLSFDALVRQMLIDFGVVRPDQFDPIGAAPPADALVRALHRFLHTLIPIDARAVVIIDEAQHLSADTLERVRVLSNFETNTTKLLQIILVGQPPLARLIDSPAMSQVRQRISCRCGLQPLTPREVSEYIERRMWVVQGDPTAGESTGAAEDDHRSQPHVRFSRRAVSRIARISGGVPRLINVLCDRALDGLADRGGRTVSVADVTEAARRLHLRLNARHVRQVVTSVPVSLVAAAVLFGVRGAAPPSPSHARVADVMLAAATAPTTNTQPTVVDAPLPSSPAFLVSVAAFRTKQHADAAVERLSAEGFPAFARLDASGGWHTVVIGPYVTRPEAMETVQRLPREFAAARIVGEN